MWLGGAPHHNQFAPLESSHIHMASSLNLAVFKKTNDYIQIRGADLGKRYAEMDKAT
jgi:hypothetical protein